jgi:tetratricopeptide (TPR) repeat protein
MDHQGFNNLGSSYYNLGETDLSIKAFERSIELKENVKAYSNLGTLYLYKRRYEDAVKNNEKAVELNKNNESAWGNLADAYRFAQRNSQMVASAYERAIKLARDKLELNAKDADALSILAVNYAKMEKFEIAVKEITRARNLAPNDFAVLRRCIIVLELSNQRDKALEVLREYKKLDGSLYEINENPFLTNLRLDKNYQKLIKK